GLSATQRPIEAVARLLVGAGQGRSNPDGSPRCAVVDVGHRRALDLALELPDDELGAVASAEQMAEILDRIAGHVKEHRTTLVCQVGSPRSFATLIQRVGRSNHTRFGTPRGVLYPTSRDELVECAALLRGTTAGRLDAIVQPAAPLDIVAQQVVAECAAEEWS